MVQIWGQSKLEMKLCTVKWTNNSITRTTTNKSNLFEWLLLWTTSLYLFYHTILAYWCSVSFPTLSFILSGINHYHGWQQQYVWSKKIVENCDVPSFLFFTTHVYVFSFLQGAGSFYATDRYVRTHAPFCEAMQILSCIFRWWHLKYLKNDATTTCNVACIVLHSQWNNNKKYNLIHYCKIGRYY